MAAERIKVTQKKLLFLPFTPLTSTNTTIHNNSLSMRAVSGFQGFWQIAVLVLREVVCWGALFAGRAEHFCCDFLGSRVWGSGPEGSCFHSRHSRHTFAQHFCGGFTPHDTAPPLQQQADLFKASAPPFFCCGTVDADSYLSLLSLFVTVHFESQINPP